MTDEPLQHENEELRHQLKEARELIAAIRSGAVDAFVVEGATGDQVYTLHGADRPYRILVERMQQGAVTLDHSGTIVYCNARFAELVDRPHQRLIGDSFREWILSDDRPLLDRLLREIPVRTGQSESSLIRQDGLSIPVLLALNPLPEDCGATVGVLVTDLTAQRHQEKLNAAMEATRESEARFRQLADAIPQLAWTAGPDGRIDWFNNRWYEYTGTTLEQMQGWGWQAVHSPEMLPQVLERWNASLASGEPFSMAFPLRSSDGSYRTFLTKVMPFHDGEGRIARWFGTNTDISEQQSMQDELRRIAGELSEAGRRKDEFLATLAHELRNPLSPIKSATQLMQMIGDDVTQFRELGHVIDRQVQQMVRLIDDLLDISRISRGKITLQREPSDLREVVRTALEATAPFIEKSGHELDVENSADPLFVLGDAARLSQVLVNLLNNAAKYTPTPGTISISLIRDNEHALIRVRDNGLGISSDDLARVFEMFEQLNIEKQRGQAGLGIGLSLVKNLVELHDGEVLVDSEGRGHGSVFSVRLPLFSEHTSTTTTIDKQAGDPAPNHSFRVLVVEDIRANRAMLVRLLQMMGHEVAEAADGREGLEMALTFQPDVILSDISMPKMNGHEMASEIRKADQLKEVKMIALTGYGQTTDREYAKASGFDGYMVKPADAATLANYFSELADKRNLANR